MEPLGVGHGGKKLGYWGVTKIISESIIRTLLPYSSHREPLPRGPCYRSPAKLGDYELKPWAQ